MMRKLLLEPRETMRRKRAKDRLDVDAGNIHRVIRNNPGIASKHAIATQTGLSTSRVADVIKQINAGETGHTRVEYGLGRPRGGPNAGQDTLGWYAMNIKRHHEVMNQADERDHKIELGVRRERLVRVLEAQGISGAEAIVSEIETRLGVSVELMSQSDLEAFEELLAEEAETRER